jgi:hypothetical protein
VGVTGAMLLALPVAGYLARRLHAISPRFGRVAGPAFAFGFALLVVATAVQHILPVAGSWRLHPVLAGSSVGCFILGMCCCCAGALGDYLRSIGGRRLLSGALTCLWVLLPLVPAACLAGLGALMLLGQGAGLLWAEDYRQSFRHTMMWQLAFWEWIGAVLAFAFLLGSAALLPASCGRSNEIETESGGVALPNLRPERGSRSGRAGSRTWTTES